MGEHTGTARRKVDPGKARIRARNPAGDEVHSYLMSQKAKAIEFRRLHLQGDILVIGNAWDVPSARIFEQAGFPSIGTTSAGIAIAHGYPDGQKITREEMLHAIIRIAHAVSIPVTADIEAGYADTAAEIADTTTRVIATGVVGLNLEDTEKTPQVPLVDVKMQVAKIAIIRKIAGLSDIPVVINARTDAILHGTGDKKHNVEDAIMRGNEYLKAGADCFFPVGVYDSETISEIVKRVNYPINILATTNVPPIPELRRLGVRRVSVGSGPQRATLGLTQRIARELREKGTYSSMLEGTPPFAEANKLVAP